MSAKTHKAVVAQLPLEVRASLPWPRCKLRSIELPLFTCTDDCNKPVTSELPRVATYCTHPIRM